MIEFRLQSACGGSAVSDLLGGASEHEHCTPRNGISIIKGPSSLLNLLPRRNVTAWA
jgi:hypothetical protein